jgi:hypothetical protein
MNFPVENEAERFDFLANLTPKVGLPESEVEGVKEILEEMGYDDEDIAAILRYMKAKP